MVIMPPVPCVIRKNLLQKSSDVSRTVEKVLIITPNAKPVPLHVDAWPTLFLYKNRIILC